MTKDWTILDLIIYFFLVKLMTFLYSLFEENWTIPIPKETAVQICQQIKKYYEGKKLVYTNRLCHFCKGNIYKNSKNNRGCSLINHLYDKFHQNKP